jgi:hypothetical protein
MPILDPARKRLRSLFVQCAWKELAYARIGIHCGKCRKIIRAPSPLGFDMVHRYFRFRNNLLQTVAIRSGGARP